MVSHAWQPWLHNRELGEIKYRLCPRPTSFSYFFHFHHIPHRHTIDKALHYDQTSPSHQARTQPFRCWYPPPYWILQKIPHYSGKCRLGNVGLLLLTPFLRGNQFQHWDPTSLTANHPRTMEIMWHGRGTTRILRWLWRMLCKCKKYKAIITYPEVFKKLY